jgi:hypothetical protein
MIKDKLKAFVQEYNPKGRFCFDEHYELEEVPLTMKTLLYNIKRKFLALDHIYQIRMLGQHLFRKSHLNDFEISEAHFSMAKKMLPIVVEFKKQHGCGYPGVFTEYSETEWGSREKYDEAISQGRIIGGGQEAWEKILDGIIRSLEAVVYEGNRNKMHDWYLKYFGLDPYDELKVNEYMRYEFRYNDDEKWVGHHMSFNEKPKEKPCGFESYSEELTHGNSELLRYIHDVVQQGFNDLGKYFQCFWY